MRIFIFSLVGLLCVLIGLKAILVTTLLSEIDGLVLINCSLMWSLELINMYLDGFHMALEWVKQSKIWLVEFLEVLYPESQWLHSPILSLPLRVLFLAIHCRIEIPQIYSVFTLICSRFSLAHFVWLKSIGAHHCALEYTVFLDSELGDGGRVCCADVLLSVETVSEGSVSCSARCSVLGKHK